MAKTTWTEERTQSLVEAVAGRSTITQEDLTTIAEQLGTTSRSIGSKLRSLAKEGVIEVEVQKASEVSRLTWPAEEEAELKDFLAQNPGAYTYGEISAVFMNGKYNTKQLQGKILSLELTDAIKKVEKVAPVRSYSVAEEEIYIAKAAEGASLEAIAELLGRSVQSARGKGLSLVREGRISTIPAQAAVKAAVKVDFLEGIEVAAMTVEEIAEATGRSARGIKNALSRRGLACKNHDGAARRAKLDKKSAKDEA